MNSLISPQAYDCFSQLAEVAPKCYASSLDDLSIILKSQSLKWSKPDSHSTPERMAQRLFDTKFSRAPKTDVGALKLSLIARLAVNTPDLVEIQNLPNDVLDHYPAAFDRLATALKKSVDQSPDTANILFHKIGFVLGISIPCGAQLLDLKSSIPLSSAVLSVYRERSVKSIARYLGCMGVGAWFRGHTDTEYLDEFNEAGWDRFYLRIAELLPRREYVRGLVGTSWFYDPQLVSISPQIAYLQQRQLERGAFLMRHRALESDVAFATKTSSTRRKLYQEGNYIPVSHSLVWGRNEILSWANKF